MKKAISASAIFDGEKWLADHSVIIVNGTIEKVCLSSEMEEHIEVTHLPGTFLYPAFIDAQVY